MKDLHLDWKYLLADFHGRIPRKHFWIAFGAIFVVNVLCYMIGSRAGGERLAAIVDLLFVYPEFAIAAKRAHDRDRPTWVPGIFFAGSVLDSFLVVLGFSAESADTFTLVLLVALQLPLLIFGLALLVDLGFRQGTPGPNRFGPEPPAH